jgi:chromosome segregation ATPase
MSWEIVILALGLLINFAVSIDGRRKSTAERDKLEAETAQLYANMAKDAAEREKTMRGDITRLEATVKEQRTQIEELREISEQKDGRIKELEDLTHKQEAEIRGLRAELDQLKKPKSQ